MRAPLPVLVARYDALGNAIARLRESIRAIETAQRARGGTGRTRPRGDRPKVLRAAAGRQLQRLRCRLDELIVQRRSALVEMIACASRIPAFIHAQTARGVGPVRAARMLTSAIDAFDEKRQFDQIVAAISRD